MSASDNQSNRQRIARLTPLDDALRIVTKTVAPVGPGRVPLAQALCCTLAEDVAAPILPREAIALRDGFAVDAASVADAGPYAPVALPGSLRPIEVGEPLPIGADAVLPIDAVAVRGDRAEVIAPVTAGEGTLAAAGDVAAQVPLRRTGQRLRAVDSAAMQAAGIAEVTVRRPRITVMFGGTSLGPAIAAGRALLVAAIANAGGIICESSLGLEATLAEIQSDAVIAIGGTGTGRRDAAVRILARRGRLEAHGIAIAPGETAAFGFVGTRPILLVPARLDAALAVWLFIGRRILACLAAGRVEDAAAVMLPLKRKISSSIGLTELIPVRCSDGMAEPLASAYLSLEALAHSDGFTVIPAASEGFAAGAPVAVRAWP
jgi:molybdopterin molybdotransferase